MKKQMTIIIPYLNEPDNEVYNTIKNIYETASSDLFSIIVIDDNSEEKYRANLSEFKSVVQIHNAQRIGVDGCRQMGGEMADTDNLLILDCHMRFVKGSNWLETMVKCCEDENDTVFCTTSLGLGYNSGMDLSKYSGKYYAADILFHDKDAIPNRPSRECLEPKWRNKEDKGMVYEVPCVLGAVYFMTKQRFDLLHGFKGLKMWGSSEVFLSLKNFLAGGANKIHTGIEVGHRYRDNSPFVTEIRWLYFNKAYICKTLFSEDIGNKIINYLPKDINFTSAMKLMEENKEEIEKERKYYQFIFKYSIYNFCKRFNVQLP